jgi:hypothetical protein
MILEQVGSHKEQMESELKRLRREHMANIKTIEKCETLFGKNSKNIEKVVNR